MRVAVINNGALAYQNAPDDKDAYYAWQKETVGGYIEVVMIASCEPVGGTLQLIGHDMSALHNKKPSFSWERRYPYTAKNKIVGRGFAYGTLIIEHINPEGYVFGLTDSDVARINHMLDSEKWIIEVLDA